MAKHRPDKRSDKPFSQYNTITQERAHWVMTWKSDQPLGTTTYSKTLAATMRQFTIKRGAARQAVAAYHALLREMIADPAWGEKVMARFLKIHDAAYAEKQYGAASSALAEFRDMAGLRPTEKVEHSGKLTVESAHVAALKLVPAKRKERIAELKAKARGEAPVVKSEEDDK